MLRVKDEARSLPWVLPSILRATDHVIVADNGSQDGTAALAVELADHEGLAEKLTILEYPFAVSRCGPEHLATHPDSVHSLTYFYNWAFSHVRTRYALKWDGDMVLSHEGEQLLRDLNWQFASSDVAIGMARAGVYVVDERLAFLDAALGSAEPWGWRNKPAYTFAKAFDWELMLPKAGDDRVRLPDTTCFELKWLDQDEFDHWSHLDFKETINARKRREYDIFVSLRNDCDPPDGVVRVEAPTGVHVVEYLREHYASLLLTPAAPSPL